MAKIKRENPVTCEDLLNMGYTAFMAHTPYAYTASVEAPELLSSLAEAINNGDEVQMTRDDLSGTIRIKWTRDLSVAPGREVYAIRKMTAAELLEADCGLANGGVALPNRDFDACHLRGEEKIVPVIYDDGGVADVLRLYNYDDKFADCFASAIEVWHKTSNPYTYVYAVLRSQGYRFEVIENAPCVDSGL